MVRHSVFQDIVLRDTNKYTQTFMFLFAHYSRMIIVIVIDQMNTLDIYL